MPRASMLSVEIPDLRENTDHNSVWTMLSEKFDALAGQNAGLAEQNGRLLSQTALMMEEIAALREMGEAQADRDRLYDVRALMRRWLISERAIATLVSEGLLVPTYIQSNLRFTPGAIEAYERSRAGRKHGKPFHARAARSRPHMELISLDRDLATARDGRSPVPET